VGGGGGAVCLRRLCGYEWGFVKGRVCGGVGGGVEEMHPVA